MKKFITGFIVIFIIMNVFENFKNIDFVTVLIISSIMGLLFVFFLKNDKK